MLDSVHSARWLSNFVDKEIDFFLFPSTPNRNVHKTLSELISNSKDTNAKYFLNKFLAKFSIIIWIAGILTRLTFPAFLLKRIMYRNRISIVHAMELNHAGYLVTKVYELGFPSKVKIISTNWGSDIFWFQQFPNHAKKIKKIMQISDVYSAECNRDLKLAVDFGFNGEFRSVIPNSGGFPKAEITKDNPLTSSRKNLVIKGYESFVGRASIAMWALVEISDLLHDYQIHVYSANSKTIRLAKK